MVDNKNADQIVSIGRRICALVVCMLQRFSVLRPNCYLVAFLECTFSIVRASIIQVSMNCRFCCLFQKLYYIFDMLLNFNNI